MTRSLQLAAAMLLVATLVALGMPPSLARADCMSVQMPGEAPAPGADDPLVGGMSGISMVELAVAMPVDAGAGRGGALLWCTSPNDPRCAPAHHDRDPRPHILSPLLLADGPGRDDALAPAAARVRRPTITSSGPPGVRSRLDRPPQR